MSGVSSVDNTLEEEFLNGLTEAAEFLVDSPKEITESKQPLLMLENIFWVWHNSLCFLHELGIVRSYL